MLPLLETSDPVVTSVPPSDTVTALRKPAPLMLLCRRHTLLAGLPVAGSASMTHAADSLETLPVPHADPDRRMRGAIWTVTPAVDAVRFCSTRPSVDTAPRPGWDDVPLVNSGVALHAPCTPTPFDTSTLPAATPFGTEPFPTVPRRVAGPCCADAAPESARASDAAATILFIMLERPRRAVRVAVHDRARRAGVRQQLEGRHAVRPLEREELQQRVLRRLRVGRRAVEVQSQVRLDRRRD